MHSDPDSKSAQKASTAKKAPLKKNLKKKNKGKKKKGNKKTEEKKTDKKKTRDKGGYSSPEKGKIVTMDKVDSDKDSLDLGNDEGLVESLAEACKESKAKRPVVISVGGSITNVADGYKYSLVVFPNPGKKFYYKAEHQKTLLTHALK